MRHFLKSLAALCLGGLSLLAATPAAAQSWPPERVRIIVPYPPGTEPDVLARDLASALAAQSGKTFFVDNKPGANAQIGTRNLVDSPPDGSTLLLVDRLSVVVNPLLYAALPYDWEKDLAPVADLAAVRLFLSVRHDFPAATLTEFLNWARAHPGQVNMGTGGNGHVTHIGMAMLAQAHGVQLTDVPYKGVAPAIQGILGGEVDAVLAGGLVTRPHIESGRIRALVVGDTKRAPVLPDVPTLAEAGGAADSIPSTVFTLFASGKMAATQLAQITSLVQGVLATPALLTRYNGRGLEVLDTSPETTRKAMLADSVRYRKILREAGIRMQ